MASQICNASDGVQIGIRSKGKQIGILDILHIRGLSIKR